MKKLILTAAAGLLALAATSCIDDSPETYADWRKQNDEYLTRVDTEEYTRVTADWAPGHCVYIKWHNDRRLTESELTPLSNSTVNIKYELEDIEGNDLGNSYSLTTNGDSIYQSKPNENIIGMWIAMTNMHVGDSVSMIIPYSSAYGAATRNGIKPYSDLIYRVKMKGIPNYEKK